MDIQTKFYSQGIALPATVHIPDGGNEAIQPGMYSFPEDLAARRKKYPAVIMFHGHARYRDDGFDRLAQVLGERGIVSLRFDFRGCGCEGERQYRHRPMSELRYDAQCAIDYLESLPFIDRQRIGATGVSMGGVMTYMIAGTDKRIRSCAPMSASGSVGETFLRRWGDRKEAVLEILREDARINAATGETRYINRMSGGFVIAADQQAQDDNLLEELLIPGNSGYTTLETIYEFVEYSAWPYIEKISCPTFVIHGAQDAGVKYAYAKEAYDRLPAACANKRFTSYEGADHNIPICAVREIIFADIADWFISTLA